MEVILIKALQLILCFSLLILCHEGGHFFFAKLFGVRVEKFCLFFGRSWRLFTWRGTDYCIGWLPLGGYVKIAGMVDESLDTKQLEGPAQPWEFRSKPAWQRLLIMVGGVLVNFLLALFIYAMTLFTWGESYVPIDKMSAGFKFNAEAQSLGFRDGDIPLRTDRGAFTRLDGDTYRELSKAQSVTVLRAGSEHTFSLPGDLNLLHMLQDEPPFMAVLSPSVVDSVAPGTPAAKAGMLAGDSVVAVNGQGMTTWNEYNLLMNDLRASIETYQADGDAARAASLRQVTYVVRRAASKQVDTLHVVLGADGLAGFIQHNPYADYPVQVREYGFFESFPAGARHGCNVLRSYVDDLRYVFTRDGAQSVGSVFTIGSLFSDQWYWPHFWSLTAFISIMLAFLNILPIPALDGGHVLFLLYEVVTKRRPSLRFMERAQIVGMWLLVGLMVFALFNDFMRFIF